MQILEFYFRFVRCGVHQWQQQRQDVLLEMNVMVTGSVGMESQDRYVTGGDVPVNPSTLELIKHIAYNVIKLFYNYFQDLGIRLWMGRKAFSSWDAFY